MRHGALPACERAYKVNLRAARETRYLINSQPTMAEPFVGDRVNRICLWVPRFSAFAFVCISARARDARQKGHGGRESKRVAAAATPRPSVRGVRYSSVMRERSDVYHPPAVRLSSRPLRGGGVRRALVTRRGHVAKRKPYLCVRT